MPLRKVHLSALAAAALVALGCLRIAATYRVFNATYDEPAHVAAGLQWLARGTYGANEDQTPLARIAVAVGPYLAGIRYTGRGSYEEGNAALATGGRYLHNLALARLGALPFFVLSGALVWWVARRWFGEGAALASVLLFTLLPPVLAHAGLATTDVAVVPFMLAAVYSFAVWLDRPGWRQAVVLGLSCALAVLAKYSAVVFIPAAGAAVLLLYWFCAQPRRLVAWSRILQLAAAAAVASLVIWAGYRFSVGHLVSPHSVYTRLRGIVLPADAFWRGIAQQVVHNHVGHDSALFGQYRAFGWWYFFPVVLAVKTPLAFLAMCAAGYIALARKNLRRGDWLKWVPAVSAPALLLFTMTTSIDLGVRHILPIYAFLAVVAGYGVSDLLASHGRAARATRVLGIGLLAWAAVSSVRAHPDYLAYFNELAGSHPERILAESDLDWGQDVLRLSIKLRELRVQEVSVALFGTAPWPDPPPPVVHQLGLYQRTTGWVALSMHVKMIEAAKMARELHRDTSPYAWLDAEKPVTRVGKSIDLYYVRDQP